MNQQENFYISAQHAELSTGRISTLFLKYAVPGVIGLLFLGVQTVIDGLVLSHFVGAKALASVSLVLPCYNFMIAVALVVAIGCQALIGIRLGQLEIEAANDALRTAFVFLTVFSVVVSLLLVSLTESIAALLGANGTLAEDSVHYIRSLVPFFPSLTLMFLGDYMLKSVGKPLFATIVMSGTVVLNIILDLLFVGVWNWGVSGAGWATGIAFTLGACCNVPPMFRRRQSVAVPNGRFRWRMLIQMFYNGSSEGVSELSAGISIFLFNLVLMKYVGADGVAAFTALEYMLFIGVTVFLGISDGIIPIVSYNYGSGRYDRVKAVLRMAVRINLSIGIFLFGLLWLAGEQMVALFFKGDEIGVVTMAVQGAAIYAFAFLFNGMNILTSSYFTAVGNARLSVIVSLLRGLIFIALGLFFLPDWFGLKGIWLVIPVAECCTLLVSVGLLRATSSGRLQSAS